MKNAIKLVVAVVLPLAVGGLSGYATAQGVRSWYPTLVKPFFNPPAWIFGPVWTALYILMGVAAFLVWRRGLEAEGVKAGLTLFLAQLALNGLWSILFFGIHSPGLAFVEILVLWIAIAATIRAFGRVSAAAAWLLAPYLAWVSFATILTGSIWWLNR
jgi:benzodiazapine receptor